VYSQHQLNGNKKLTNFVTFECLIQNEKVTQRLEIIINLFSSINQTKNNNNEGFLHLRILKKIYIFEILH
jgi:hypothetical protein